MLQGNYYTKLLMFYLGHILGQFMVPHFLHVNSRVTMFYQDARQGIGSCCSVFTLASTEMPIAGLVPRYPSTQLAAASMLLHYSVFSHSQAVLLLLVQRR